MIAEPSSLRIARGNRGRLGLRIDVKGRAGHASNPGGGKNAIYESLDIIAGIKNLNEVLARDSVAVTKVETANKNINIIPEICSIYCDYRSDVGRTQEDIFGELAGCVGDKGIIDIITPYYRPWQMDSGHPLISASMECLKKKLGKDEIITWDFCTNGSYTAGELGIPTVGFGPGKEDEAHSAEEKIKIESVKKAVDFFGALPGFISGTCM